MNRYRSDGGKKISGRGHLRQLCKEKQGQNWREIEGEKKDPNVTFRHKEYRVQNENDVLDWINST